MLLHFTDQRACIEGASIKSKLSGEYTLVIQENRFRIGSVSAIEWHVGESETLRDIAKRSFYYGRVVRTYLNKRGGFAVRQLSPLKPGLFLELVKTGSPYLPSLAIVDVTRWVSSLLGLALSSDA
jgi:hypothetical protein